MESESLQIACFSGSSIAVQTLLTESKLRCEPILDIMSVFATSPYIKVVCAFSNLFMRDWWQGHTGPWDLP